MLLRFLTMDVPDPEAARGLRAMGLTVHAEALEAAMALVGIPIRASDGDRFRFARAADAYATRSGG